LASKDILSAIRNLLIEKNHTPKQIQEKLNYKFNTKFNYQKIRNIYYKVKRQLFGQVNNEAKDLIDLLETLQQNELVHFDKLLSPEGNLQALVFMTPGMISLYKLYKDMMILDTTFGLNRFNMPVLTLAGVNNEGKTIIFGFAFLPNECAEYKRWVFEKFLTLTNEEAPESVITDGCPAFSKALKEVFPNAKTYYCGWHIQLNLKRHFSGFKKKLEKKGMTYIIIF